MENLKEKYNFEEMDDDTANEIITTQNNALIDHCELLGFK